MVAAGVTASLLQHALQELFSAAANRHSKSDSASVLSSSLFGCAGARQDLGPGLLVATTHVLFNPKRGDIKVPLLSRSLPCGASDLPRLCKCTYQIYCSLSPALQQDLPLAARNKGAGLLAGQHEHIQGLCFH